MALKLSGQATEADYSNLVFIVSNSLIALSGFILYSDKALTWLNLQFDIPSKWEAVGMDFPTFVWFLSQTISPVLIILGASLKPRTLMYAIPIYCYMLQLYWIFLDYKIVDDSYLQVYVIGTSVLVMAALLGMRWLLYKRVGLKIEKAKKRILRDG